ncbi:MAG: PTS sugar transporter subunit IIA [Myxococcales bacterium]|nr:PTS sugar transporter subunit IIA [Myxococcales bacterium]
MPMVNFADSLREDLVFWDLPRQDKPSLLKALSGEVAARLSAVDAAALYDQLLAREAEQSTGIGGGLALPHATVAGLEQPLLVVGRTREGVDFAAPDSRPVDLFFLLLSPPGAEAQHLRVLARLARIFAREERVERLRSATGPEALFQMLLDEDARHVY